MAVTIKRDGYGQVEDNHLSAKRDGRVYAQLPAADTIEVLQQGMFVKYDMVNGELNFTGAGPWMMVYNEEKLYDERKQNHKDFALTRDESWNKEMYSRVLGMVPGDIYTTNMVKEEALTVGDKLQVGADGILAKAAAPKAGELTLQVVKETTMPDMQPAVKLQVISA